MTLEYFEATPGEMPEATYAQHHILLKLLEDPIRVETWRGGVWRAFTLRRHADGTLSILGALGSADEARVHADDIAERAVSLGGTALGRTQDVASAATLAEYPADISAGKDHVAAVADRLATTTNAMRASIDEADQAGDAVTADLFTGVARGLDKQLWFVEAHQQ